MAVLVAGILVYLLDRPGSSVYFVPEWWVPNDLTPFLFGRLGDYLPSFAHVYAFILLTAAAMMPGRKYLLAICGFWLGLDASFEIAQIDSLATMVSDGVPVWFYRWPLLDNTAHYFVRGRFDPLDLVAITLGTVAAYLTVRWSVRRGEMRC